MLQFCQWRQKQKVSNTSNNCWYTLIYTFGYIKHMRWLYQSDAKWSGKWKMWKMWKMWKCQSAKVPKWMKSEWSRLGLSIWDSTPAICHGGAAVKPSSHVKLPKIFGTLPNTFLIHFLRVLRLLRLRGGWIGEHVRHVISWFSHHDVITVCRWVNSSTIEGGNAFTQPMPLWTQ